MTDFWDYTFLNNTVKDWCITAAIIVVAFLLLRLFTLIIINRLQTITKGTKSTIDDFVVYAINRAILPVMYVLAFYLGLKFLSVPNQVEAILNIALMAVVTFFAIRLISSLAKYIFSRAEFANGDKRERTQRSNGILFILQSILWVAGLLFLVDNLGYDITTIVAGLGIGGIAIALAAQTILADLFSYLVIFFDKPFEEGDFIIIDDKMGSVEYIGIKTTRLRTLSGEQLICSNTDLTNSRVHNYKRMQERRIVFSFGVVYSTPAVTLKKIPDIVKDVILSIGDCRFDRAHFQTFGDFSLNFQVVYYVLSADYNVYMDKQQMINLRLFELFEQENIEFAFPTQTVMLNATNKDYSYASREQ